LNVRKLVWNETFNKTSEMGRFFWSSGVLKTCELEVGVLEFEFDTRESLFKVKEIQIGYSRTTRN
jgi:hypothetical protein